MELDGEDASKPSELDEEGGIFMPGMFSVIELLPSVVGGIEEEPMD